METTDAVVVGGGIVGAATAYHLARADVRTLLVDRADDGRATDAGAGIVSPATSSRRTDDDWFAFAREAADYYPRLADRLRTETDRPTGYGEPGLLSVAVTAAGREAFERTLERARERRASDDAPTPGPVEELDAREATERFPPLGPVQAAAEYAGAARVDGRRFTRALRAAGEGHGLAVERAAAEAVDVEDGSVAGVVVDGTRRPTENVVVAGGAWSPAFADDLGLEVPVAPERGQIVHLAVDADTADWPILAVAGGHYAVPWPDGRVAVGATRELDAGFDPTVTAGGMREVLASALDAAPGLREARVTDLRAGLRPTSRDRLPILGSVPEVEGAYLATGHGATGLQLGPYSGRLVARLVRGVDPGTDVDRSTFAPSRFG